MQFVNAGQGLLDLRSSECDVVSLYVMCCSVNVSVCFVYCVFDSVCELFGETIRNVFGCSSILLLNVMELLEVLYWIDHVWYSIECVCCACGHSERLDAPFLPYGLFVFLYVRSYLLI